MKGRKYNLVWSPPLSNAIANFPPKTCFVQWLSGAADNHQKHSKTVFMEYWVYSRNRRNCRTALPTKCTGRPVLNRVLYHGWIFQQLNVNVYWSSDIQLPKWIGLMVQVSVCRKANYRAELGNKANLKPQKPFCCQRDDLVNGKQWCNAVIKYILSVIW